MIRHLLNRLLQCGRRMLDSRGPHADMLEAVDRAQLRITAEGPERR